MNEKHILPAEAIKVVESAGQISKPKQAAFLQLFRCDRLCGGCKNGLLLIRGTSFDCAFGGSPSDLASKIEYEAGTIGINCPNKPSA